MVSSPPDMRPFVLRLMSFEGFLKRTLTVYTEEMSTTASPTAPSSQLTSDQLVVVAASFSSLVFFVVFVVLLSIIYRKDLQCCKHHSYQEPHTDMDAPPQYYSSRQTLVSSPCLDQTQIGDDSSTQRAGELFYVSQPSSYSLPTLEAPLPRLPSYESVRKKDRQRQIHMMIADRFGLNEPIVTERWKMTFGRSVIDGGGFSRLEESDEHLVVHEGEKCYRCTALLIQPPPTYEESIRQSVEFPCDVLSSRLDISPLQSFYTNTLQTDAAHQL